MAKNSQIDQSMIENIKNYSSKIKTIEHFCDHVRMCPSMYIGYIGNKGHVNMIREILQNSSDEVERKDSPCDTVFVTYDERNHMTVIQDNGRGIPFNDIERIFTTEHTSSNYSKNTGEYTSGRHGVGGKVTNALSSKFIVESFILGKAMKAEFENGKISGKIMEIPNKENLQGTRVTFFPCYEIMGNLTTTVEEVLALILLVLPLTTLNTKINFFGIKLDGTTRSENLINIDGPTTHLINMTTSPLIMPIRCSADNGNMKADICFTYDSSSLTTERILSFANFCPTIAGSHVNGFKQGLCNWFRKYMNTIYLSNSKSKITIVNSDILTGLVACLVSAHLMPNFVGQHKDEIDNADLGAFINDLIITTLDNWAKTNSGDLQKLCKYFIKIAEIRLKSDGEKIKLTSTFQASKITGKPQKYEPPTGKTNLELVIVEGDSAKGPAVAGRDHKRQGIIPIRGKIPNAFSTPKVKFLQNEEITALIHICGDGDLRNFGKNFDINKCPFEKVICMADADADGNHIDSLLLRFFLLYMLPLIEHGRLYRAVPPLYGIKNKKNTTYFTDRKEFVYWRQKAFNNKFTITDINNNKLSNDRVCELLMKNIDYAITMKALSDTYSVEPYLLELVLSNIDKPLNQLTKILKSAFRFVDVTKENGILICKAEINYQRYTLFLNDNFIKASQNVMYYIRENNNMMYKVNGNPISLYGLMSLFDSEIPSNLSRYKGLGEQNPNDLKVSALHPDYDRVLIQYTVEDAKKEIEAIRYFESNKYDLVKDAAKTVTRFDIG